MCTFVFRYGESVSSRISQGKEQKSTVYHPLFFCLDLPDSIVISDHDHRYKRCLKFCTRSEEFVHSIGREVNKKGEFISPYGSAISMSGVIMVVPLVDCILRITYLLPPLCIYNLDYSTVSYLMRFVKVAKLSRKLGKPYFLE